MDTGRYDSTLIIGRWGHLRRSRVHHDFLRTQFLVSGRPNKKGPYYKMFERTLHSVPKAVLVGKIYIFIATCILTVCNNSFVKKLFVKPFPHSRVFSCNIVICFTISKSTWWLMSMWCRCYTSHTVIKKTDVVSDLMETLASCVDWLKEWLRWILRPTQNKMIKLNSD